MHLGSGGEVLKLKRLQKNIKNNSLPDAEKSAGSGSVTADRLVLVAVFSGKTEKKETEVDFSPLSGLDGR